MPLFHNMLLILMQLVNRLMSSINAKCVNKSAKTCQHIPEQHPSMTTSLKHLKSHTMPPRAEMPGGLPVAPAMQTIIVDCVPIAPLEPLRNPRNNANICFSEIVRFSYSLKGWDSECWLDLAKVLGTKKCLFKFCGVFKMC